jgi:hypothetical protein
MIAQIPTRLFQLRVDHFLAGLVFGYFAGHESPLGELNFE